MNIITLEAIAEMRALNEAVPQGKHIITGDIRRLSARLFRKIEDRRIDNVLVLCEELLSQHDWALGVIAFDWAYRVKKQYNAETYGIFFGWLKKYVRGWGDCDDFCTHAFGELLRSRKELFSSILEWTKDGDFWVRRASAVVLIPAILHNDYHGISPFMISDALICDGHTLVLKGYGWMLKCYSQVEPETVKGYLIDRRTIMPRVAFRYALEKYDAETRNTLLKL